MKLILSICIPTLNRPDYLLQAVKSILANKSTLHLIEICISNNSSELDYSGVEGYLESVSNLCRVKYITQKTRISLDENHHHVKKMAETDFIYFLGDDDFFLENGVEKLIEFIEAKNPDLAIFNGILVDANSKSIGSHFNLPIKEYKTVDDAFKDLRDKGTFGAVLVRRALLQDNDFIKLYGTSHAYGCYWLSFLREYELDNAVKIFIPEFPCVALRVAQKNYNHIAVYFQDIPNEMEIYYQNFGAGKAQFLLNGFNTSYNKKLTSIKFLYMLSDSGGDLGSIFDFNQKFYRDNAIKICICGYIFKSSTFIFLKKYMRFAKNILLNKVYIL